MSVNIPLTGSGGTTATVAADAVGGEQYQYVKVANGVAGSTVMQSVLATTPAAADPGAVVRPIGSTAYSQAAVLVAGSSGSMVGAVALSSNNAVYLGLGSSATYNFMQSIPFSSGNVSRSSISTTVDVQLIAANASRKALVIANRSTAQTVGIGFSTAVLTTALANVDVFLAPSAALSFGLYGGLPLYLGPLRGLNLTSTTVAGSVGVTEFT